MSAPNLNHIRTCLALRGVNQGNYAAITKGSDKQTADMGLKHDTSLNDDHVDVLVIGAGPAGLMASLWMAEYGIKTRVVDRRGTRTLHGRADGIHVRSMEIWESFDMVDTVLKHGFGINEWCLWGPDEDGSLHRKQRKCALGTDLSRFPVGMMHQGHIEATMIESLRKRKGASIERGTIPTSIEVDDSQLDDPSAYPIRVNLRRLRKNELDIWHSDSHTKAANGVSKLTTPDIAFPIFADDHQDIVDTISGEEGSTETVHAKYVVGADGAKSWVRKHLGLKMSGSDKESVWGVIDLRPISNFPDVRKNCTVQTQDGTLLIVPREKGLVRIYVMFTEDVPDNTALDEIIGKIKTIMSPFKFDYNLCDWWTIYRVAQKVSNTYSYKDRVYMAGDAVHTHTPKGGQGMNVSIQDAYNLGWKLGMVLKGYADKHILDTYEKERRPVAKGLIEMDTDLSRILASKSTEVTADDVKRIYERLRDYGSGVNIHYEPSIINVNPWGPPKTNVQVGKRFPSFQVYSQATGLPVEIQQLLKSDGRWRLMVFAGIVSKRLHLDRVNELGEQLAGLMKRYPITTDGKSFLEVLLVHASRESDVEINDFHNTYFSFDAEKGFDYDRVFTRIKDGPHEDSRCSHSKQRPTFSTGCLIAMRPDQHVGWIGRLDEFDLLQHYFEGFMVPRDTSIPSTA